MLDFISVENDEVADAFFTDLRRDPVLFYDLATSEVVVLQRDMIAAVKAAGDSGVPDLPETQRPWFLEAREVMQDGSGRYLRMPEVSADEVTTWVNEFMDDALDCSKTDDSCSPRQVFADWPNFRAHKLLEAFGRWVDGMNLEPGLA